jgi:hypothetical protein
MSRGPSSLNDAGRPPDTASRPEKAGVKTLRFNAIIVRTVAEYRLIDWAARELSATSPGEFISHGEKAVRFGRQPKTTDVEE